MDDAPRRLLLLNWRDPWHPRAGGAELLTLRVMERLTARGWSVDWFSGAYRGAASREVRQGITFIREGSGATVHLYAFVRYARRRDHDLVIDQINTIPFFGPWYAVPCIAWFQQLAREVWLYEGGILGPIGFLAEPLYLLPYRKTPLITISASSARSLREIGLRGPVRILPMAVDEPADRDVPEKEGRRDILVIGRLTPSKRIQESIRAAALLRSEGWAGRLHIVGSGTKRYRAELERCVAKVMLRDSVIFHGRVDEAERSRLMRAASILWMTSLREGWGLVVTEAARHGTPAVVYDVPGLCDAVRDGVTGRVVPAQPRALADATGEVLRDFGRYATAALNSVKDLDWEVTAAAFRRAVEELSAMDVPAGTRLEETIEDPAHDQSKPLRRDI